MKTPHLKIFSMCIWGIVIAALAGCNNFTPVAEPDEFTKTPEVTQTLPEIKSSTTTSTPEPPTLTPPPTITRTPVPIVEYDTETVSFMTEDLYTLEGILYLTEGDTAVVFAHMAGDNDQQNWVPFAKKAASRGFTSLTFNFRCYGNSECGGKDSGSVLISRDIGAAINFLRSKGFERIVCIGASMGGRACVNAAFEQELVGLVIVSGTGSSDPDRQDLAYIVSPEMQKLFIVSKNDHTTDRTLTMTNLSENAPEPKTFKLFSGSAHGTELFDSPNSLEFRDMLYDFLEDIR